MDEISSSPSSSQQESEEAVKFPLILQLPKRSRSRSIIRSSQQGIYKRILQRDGKFNIFTSNIPKKRMRYFKDIGNTLIHIRWRWILFCLFLVNCICYLVFAGMWMAVAVINHDKDKKILHEKCIVGTETFAGYLLLSIESLTTIGFGMIYPTDCHGNWVVLTLTHMAMVAIEGAIVTAVYIKLSRPHQRVQLENFSKKAVICLRDDNFCLVFRIRDSVKKYWSKTVIKAYFCSKRKFNEGEEYAYYMMPLNLEYFGEFLWPLDMVHVIKPSSPLWDISAKDLLTIKFEILVVIEGESYTTGQPSQTRMSYTNSEVLWGHRFASCINYDEKKETYIIDDKLFNTTHLHEIPLCSASRLHQVFEDISSSSGVHSI